MTGEGPDRTQSSERPEGRRTFPRGVSVWSLAGQALALIVGWALSAYGYQSAPVGLATWALRTAFGIGALLTLGWAVEAFVMRKHWGLWSGAALIAAWLSYTATFPKGTRWVIVLGFAGLVLATIVPAEDKGASRDLQDAFLASHPRYARMRPAVIHFVLGASVALAALGFVSGVFGALTPG